MSYQLHAETMVAGIASPASPVSVNKGSIVTFKTLGQDGDGLYSFTWYVGTTEIRKDLVNQPDYYEEMPFYHAFNYYGVYTVECVVTDVTGESKSVYWTVNVVNNTPPSPNPMTFSSAPYTASTTSISMTATYASGPSGQTQYYFDAVSGSPGRTDSGWQSSRSYTDSGLSANTQYGYKVKAKDTSNDQATSLSSEKKAYTLQKTPSISVDSRTTSSVTLEVTNLSNNSGLYWQNSNENDAVGDNGSSGWITSSYSFTDSGLQPGRRYKWTVKAKNGEGIETSTDYQYATTFANTPSAPSVNAVDESSVTVNVNPNGNPSIIKYAIYCKTNGKYVTLSGGFQLTPVWQINSVWGTTTVSGLSSDTAYEFQSKARNEDDEETSLSPMGSAKTEAIYNAGTELVGFNNSTAVVGRDDATPAATLRNIEDAGIFKLTVQVFKQGNSTPVYSHTCTSSTEIAKGQFFACNGTWHPPGTSNYYVKATAKDINGNSFNGNTTYPNPNSSNPISFNVAGLSELRVTDDLYIVSHGGGAVTLDNRNPWVVPYVLYLKHFDSVNTFDSNQLLESDISLMPADKTMLSNGRGLFKELTLGPAIAPRLGYGPDEVLPDGYYRLVYTRGRHREDLGTFWSDFSGICDAGTNWLENAYLVSENRNRNIKGFMAAASRTAYDSAALWLVMQAFDRSNGGVSVLSEACDNPLSMLSYLEDVFSIDTSMWFDVGLYEDKVITSAINRFDGLTFTQTIEDYSHPSNILAQSMRSWGGPFEKLLYYGASLSLNTAIDVGDFLYESRRYPPSIGEITFAVSNGDLVNVSSLEPTIITPVVNHSLNVSNAKVTLTLDATETVNPPGASSSVYTWIVRDLSGNTLGSKLGSIVSFDFTQEQKLDVTLIADAYNPDRVTGVAVKRIVVPPARGAIDLDFTAEDTATPGEKRFIVTILGDVLIQDMREIAFEFGDGMRFVSDNSSGSVPITVKRHSFSQNGTYKGAVAFITTDGRAAQAAVEFEVTDSPGLIAGRPSSLSVPLSDTDGNYIISWGTSGTNGAIYVLQEATNSSFSAGLRTAYSGMGTSATINGKSNGSYYYRVKATKNGYADSNWSNGNSSIVVNNTVEHTLVITVPPSASPDSVASGGTTNLSVAANDSLGHSLSYSWTANCSGLTGNGSFSNVSSQNTSWTAPVNATDSTQDCILRGAVNDGEGGQSANESLTISVGSITPIVLLSYEFPGIVTTGGSSGGITVEAGDKIVIKFSCDLNGLDAESADASRGVYNALSLSITTPSGLLVTSLSGVEVAVNSPPGSGSINIFGGLTDPVESRNNLDIDIWFKAPINSSALETDALPASIKSADFADTGGIYDSFSFGLGKIGDTIRFAVDEDSDGLPDSYEHKYAFLSPSDSSDGSKDRDGDKLTNLQEYQSGSDPTKKDTDRDGLSDKYEFDNQLNPTDGVCPAWVCGGGGSWRHAIPLINRR